MLLVSSMMNVAVRGHEGICADFQENKELSGYALSGCWRYPLMNNHSLDQCKNELIGMISPELCESGICKFNEWLLYIGVAKLFDLTLNLAALVVAALECCRYLYGSALQPLRADGNNFYRTLGYTKLGLIIMDAVICIAITRLGSQFSPVVEEAKDVGCLGYSPTADAMGMGIIAATYGQMLCPLGTLIQDLTYRYYKANQGQRYIRLPTTIEPAFDFINRRETVHLIQFAVYLVLTSWGLFGSGMGLCYWGYNIEDARSLAESTTTQGVGGWCFYCPGDKPTVQLGAHVAVKYIAWFLVILIVLAVLSIVVVGVWLLCMACWLLPDRRDR